MMDYLWEGEWLGKGTKDRNSADLDDGYRAAHLCKKIIKPYEYDFSLLLYVNFTWKMNTCSKKKRDKEKNAS